MVKKSFFLSSLLPALIAAYPASAAPPMPICVQNSPGVCSNVTSTYPFPTSADPCTTQLKISAPISVTVSTTTQLVALAASESIYVCGFSMSIAPSGTTAASAQFVYATAASCTTTTALSGTFGSGDLTTATSPLMATYGGADQTVMKAPSGDALCLVTAGSVTNVQGVLTYVQQ